MPDFTLNTYYWLLKVLKEQQFTFQTFAGFLKEPDRRVIILRHDVDARKMNSLQTARMENELDITATYYFRMVPQSYDEEVIKQIAELGHEIGYHYEDLSRCAAGGMRQAAWFKRLQDLKLRSEAMKSRVQSETGTARPLDNVLTADKLSEMAIASFRENLAKLRRVVPIETICMHGSPLSKYDNRLLWEKYDYRDFGIKGEPYFDINFDEVLYLTDTGRRWDGDAVSIRDKAQGTVHKARGEEPRTLHAVRRTPFPRFHSTFNIINAAKKKKLPDKIMLTIHPQRWNDHALPWVREFVWQNVKNVVKRVVAGRQR